MYNVNEHEYDIWSTDTNTLTHNSFISVNMQFKLNMNMECILYFTVYPTTDDALVRVTRAKM